MQAFAFLSFLLPIMLQISPRWESIQYARVSEHGWCEMYVSYLDRLTMTDARSFYECKRWQYVEDSASTYLTQIERESCASSIHIRFGTLVRGVAPPAEQLPLAFPPPSSSFRYTLQESVEFIALRTCSPRAKGRAPAHRECCTRQVDRATGSHL